MVSGQSARSASEPFDVLSMKSDADCLASFRQLAPELHVCDAAAQRDFAWFGVPSTVLERAVLLLRGEGYFQLDAPAWNLPIATMAKLIERFQQLGMPTPLCFIYDEFWLVFAKLHAMMSGLLGDDYKLLPDFWAWCVGGQGDEAGWSPHRDKNGTALNADGSPKSLTVWIPLTDSTPLNGCMYIIPADRDRGYPNGKGEFDLADIRALPAPAGSVLFWNQAVYHWGGRRGARHEVPARISIAFEFQSGDIPPFNQPLLEPLKLPSLLFRMKLIAKQVLQYQHMYPLAPEARDWADRTMARREP